jgi:putative endonuclease
MRNYFVYSVECANELYYTGITREAFTFERRPVTLKWYEQFVDSVQALKIEKQIKGWSRKKKKALLEKNWEDLVALSKNYSQFGSSTSSVYLI